MRMRFHSCIRIAAICCTVVLPVAGTARLLHTIVIADHKHAKAVSEVSSFLADHLPDATAVLPHVSPELEIQAPGVAHEKSLPLRNRLLLGRLLGRAPPAWS